MGPFKSLKVMKIKKKNNRYNVIKQKIQIKLFKEIRLQIKCGMCPKKISLSPIKSKKKNGNYPKNINYSK